MIFTTLIAGTFREAIAKKIFIGFLAIATLIILIFLFFVNLDTVDGMVTFMNSTGEEAVREAITELQAVIMGFSYLLIITFCLISVSSFIPSMLEKGNVDLLLSKPISKVQIVLGKFTGGILLIFGSLVYLIGSIWIILSFKSGFWNVPFLYSIFWLTFSFAVIYSLVILLGMVTRSSVLTIIIVLFLVLIITPLLASREAVFEFIDNSVIRFILDFFYYILPKPSDLNLISSSMIMGEPVKSYQPVYTSLVFMAAMLSLSIYYFKKKDF